VTDVRHERRGDHEPVTVGEVARWQMSHERRSDREHRDIRDLISGLDERTDKLTIRVAVIIGVSSVFWAVLLAIAPFLRAVLGLSNG
jgi:hypothetical protein